MKNDTFPIVFVVFQHNFHFGFPCAPLRRVALIVFAPPPPSLFDFILILFSFLLRVLVIHIHMLSRKEFLWFFKMRGGEGVTTASP